VGKSGDEAIGVYGAEGVSRESGGLAGQQETCHMKLVVELPRCVIWFR
jgi:hypothetical protein